MRKSILVAIVLMLVIQTACVSKGDLEPDPRQVVLNMIRAMEKSDRTAVAHYLDLPSLLVPGERDYTLQMDSVRLFHDPNAILDDLCKGGLTWERWMGMQRIVGDASQSGDTAFVEVSFINKSTGTQYYNKWGLRKMNDRWKVFSFGVMGGADK